MKNSNVSAFERACFYFGCAIGALFLRDMLGFALLALFVVVEVVLALGDAE